MIERNKQPNQDLYLKTSITAQKYEENYALFPYTLNEKFNVIVIDGESIDNKTTRPKCLETALKILDYSFETGGMIIFDNSDWYADTCKKLREKGFIQVDFHGFAPINAYTHTTSIFLTRNFNFPAINDIQPYYSKTSLHFKNDLLGWEI